MLPAAGLGTRMAEVTGGRPKEMLPLGEIPVLQWVIDECRQAGCSTVAIVGSPHKPEIAAYLAELCDAGLPYFEQHQPNGLADAVRSANLPRSETLVPMPDTIFLTDSPSSSLAKKLQSGAWAAVAVREVPNEHVDRYGIVGFDSQGQVNAIVEKPEPAVAPSQWAIAGRFAFSAGAMDLLHEMTDVKNLTEVIAEGLRLGHPVSAVRTNSETFDCGSPEGYFAAVEAAAR